MSEIKIPMGRKKSLKGDDGHKTFSIRVKEETLVKLDKIVKKSNRSRNELINLFIEYGIDHYEITESK